MGKAVVSKFANGDGTPSDDALGGFVGYRIRRAWLAVQADLVNALKPFGLRIITYSALALVMSNPGLSQAQLATLMEIERPNLVSIIDELQKRGLLTRDKSPKDGRAYALHLTTDGQALLGSATQAVRAHEARLTHHIDDVSRENLDAALTQIRQNIETKPNA